MESSASETLSEVLTRTEQILLGGAAGRIKVTKGGLSRFGYKNIRSISLKARRAALAKAIKAEGAETIRKALVARANLLQRRNPEVAKKMRADARWVQKQKTKTTPKRRRRRVSFGTKKMQDQLFSAACQSGWCGTTSRRRSAIRRAVLAGGGEKVESLLLRNAAQSIHDNRLEDARTTMKDIKWLRATNSKFK